MGLHLFKRPIDSGSQAVSEFREPFLAGNLAMVNIFLWFPAGGHSPRITAGVEYISNNTHGEQKFEEPLTKEGFDSLLRRIEAFCKSIDQKETT